MTDTRSRLAFLDGLRGVAIVSVLLFHAYVRWADILPFGSRFVTAPLLPYGWLGVELFFLISGFVILMTLEKTRTFQDFILRRWLRLFPAMLICSIIVAATAHWLPERPSGPVVLRDFLPGLTFIEPSWWGGLLGSPQGALETTFWSLYVEVKFYWVAGLLYFAVGRQKLLAALFLSFLAGASISAVHRVLPNLDWRLPLWLVQNSSVNQFGWFAAGGLFHQFHCERRLRVLGLAVAAAMVAALATGAMQWRETCAAGVMAALFGAAIVSPYVQRFLRQPLLIFLGFVSYPLYLLHENMVVALTMKSGVILTRVPPALLPILPILLVVALAAFVARYAEPWMREILRPLYLKVRLSLGVAQPAEESRSVLQ